MGHIAHQNETTFEVSANDDVLRVSRCPDGSMMVYMAADRGQVALTNSQVATLVTWLQRRQNTGLVGG
jgi:hypothetical protein